MSALGTIAALTLLTACARADHRTVAATRDIPDDSSFSEPHKVTIRGYTGDAMEPQLSPDGRYLLFNNRNDPAINTDLYYARKIDDDTFDFAGPIGAVNSASLDGVPSLDRTNTFYFISTRSYAQDLSTVYSGHFSGGAVTHVARVNGIAATRTGEVYFDAEVTQDGSSLYLSRGVFDGGTVPKSADLVIAERSGTDFTTVPGDTILFEHVNTTSALEYAATVSANERELFFTRFDPALKQIAILHSTRTEPNLPFGRPSRIARVTGFVEAPALSADGLSLYYHKNEGGHFVLYRVARKVSKP